MKIKIDHHTEVLGEMDVSITVQMTRRLQIAETPCMDAVQEAMTSVIMVFLESDGGDMYSRYLPNGELKFWGSWRRYNQMKYLNRSR